MYCGLQNFSKSIDFSRIPRANFPTSVPVFSDQLTKSILTIKRIYITEEVTINIL
jgi:hypothetical protein